MRNKVIDLLKNKEVSPQEKFNQALMYYRNSAHPNPGLVRGYNVKGYSAQRLEELLYDVKKAFSISDKDLAEKSTKVAPKNDAPETTVVIPTEMPSFSKGAKGNAERKALVAELGLTAESNKNVDLEAAIQNAIDAQALQMRENFIDKLVEHSESGGNFSEEELAKIQSALELTDEEFEEFKSNQLAKAFEVVDSEEEKQQKADTVAFNKVVAILEAGEVCPPSFVREAFDNKDMTDDQANEIIEKAKATLPELPKGTISKEEALAQAEKAKQAKGDPDVVIVNTADIDKADTKKK